MYILGFQNVRSSKIWASSGSSVKNLPALQEPQKMQCNPWVRKTPWRRAWQLTPVFLPGESHGQRSLAGYSPKSHQESNMTELT